MLSHERGETIRRLLTSGDYVSVSHAELAKIIAELLVAESSLTKQYSSLIQAILMLVDGDDVELIRDLAKTIESASDVDVTT
jgi:predicted nuclease of restriction endonuclease-like RecB superfamily